MKQSSLGLNNTTKRTRKREFLDAMGLVVPWAELVSLIEPYAPEIGRRGQQPFSVQTLLRIHFMQQWFKLSCRIPDDHMVSCETDVGEMRTTLSSSA